jgi:hypothetical protein
MKIARKQSNNNSNKKQQQIEFRILLFFLYAYGKTINNLPDNYKQDI